MVHFLKVGATIKQKFIFKGIMQLLKHKPNTLFDICDILNHIGFEVICKMFNVSSLVCEFESP